MEKIFANPLSDNTLILIVYKGHIQLKNKRQIAQFFKWTKDMNKHFFNLVVPMANKYMKRCLTSLISGGGGKSLQSCLLLCNPMECSLPGFSVPGILQAGILERVAISSSRDLPDPGIKPTSLMSPVLACGFFTTSATWEALTNQWRSEVKSLSRVWLLATPWTVDYQAPPSMGFSWQEYWSELPFSPPVDLPDPGI